MSIWRVVWPPLFTVSLVVLAWDLGVRLSGVAPYLLPGPGQVASTLFAERGTLLPAMWRTGTATVVGFGCAALLGVVLGTVLASVSALRRGVYPLTNLLQMVPLVAVAPLLTIWFGYGGTAVAASACIVALFPVIANTVDGLRSVDPGLRELFALHHAGRFDRWRLLELPAALPGIFTGLRVAAGLAVIGAVVGEFVSGFAGAEAPLGIVILAAMREARTDLVFAAIALSAVVGFALFGGVSAAGHLVLRRWHPSAVGDAP